MEKDYFKGKKITVMGVGLHGGAIAVIRFLIEKGARVIATDMKTEAELKTSVEKLKGLKNITLVLGQHRMEDFTNVDMVVKGPAVPWTSKHVQAALKSKIPVEMDSSIFFKMCKLPIIGITGTKGKTTTSTLIAEILKTAGKKVFTVGIGQKPVLDILGEIENTKEGVVVFELSSWRLSALGRAGISPRVAVITNIQRDHLNYYGTMEKYVADKKYIFANQKLGDYLILNHDDEEGRNISNEAKSQIVYYSPSKLDSEKSVSVEDSKIFFKNNGEKILVCDTGDTKLRGGHNLYNVLAAAAATLAYGIAPETVCEAVKNFKGVPHRLELVRERNGVKYYNDTTATMPDAAIAGINAFTEPLILIAGGSDKNLDFKDFAQAMGEKVKKVILLKGSATEKMKAELKKIEKDDKIDCEFADMEKAVIRAKSISGPGDVVLLSPGAASFGLFANEFDRGEKFREAVGKLGA